MDEEVLIQHYENLVVKLRALNTRVLLLGLLPPDERTFPGSAKHFASVNKRLAALASEQGAEFFDWGQKIPNKEYDNLFYRDGFHPNPRGSQTMAMLLSKYLSSGN